MPTLIANWRLIAYAAAFLAGMWLQGLIDDRSRAAEIAAQEQATKQAQAELDAKAMQAETALAVARLQARDLQTKWEKLRRATNHTSCRLPSDVIELLQSASQ